LEQVPDPRAGDDRRTIPGAAVRLPGRSHHAQRLHHARGTGHVRHGDERRSQTRRMNRRTFLTAGGTAAGGFGLSACAPKARPNVTPTRAPVRLAPVNASWDRIIRTTVGLRPHRDAGFVLKADKLDDKLLVHDYGHGGAGMSLAWGTGLMAAEL